MEVAFDSKDLRTICESEAHAVNELGQEVAEVLKHRVADLRAVTSPKELVAGRPRILVGTDEKCMVVDLCNGYKMAFCANHPTNPLSESGKPDWPRISRIKLLWIKHDDF